MAADGGELEEQHRQRAINADVVAALLAGQKVARPSGYDPQMLAQLGVEADEEWIWLGADVEPLVEGELRKRFNSVAGRRWPDFRVTLMSGSTNADLMALGWEAVGSGLTTEYQSAGRGRRGRSWLSPIGRNIAVSLCIAKAGDLSGMAGLSLVVGMAVTDALRTLGLEQVALKWPNDLIVMHAPDQYSKLGGILVELQHHAGSSNAEAAGEQTLAVIGVGLNFGGAQAVKSAVDQSMADISVLRSELSRHTVLVAVVNALADYIDHWDESGFEGMTAVYDELHAFTGAQVRVSGAGRTLTGTVEGVSRGGQLLLRDALGELLEIDAGEVSVRPE